MNVLAGGSARKSVLILMALAALASCGGPSAAPQPQFTEIPPLSMDGEASAGYVTILGPVTGTGSTSFTIPARSGYASWLSCVGKGQVWLRSPVGSFAAACSDDSTWAAGQTNPTHLPAGQRVTVRIVAASGTRWELRIDGPPPAS